MCSAWPYLFRTRTVTPSILDQLKSKIIFGKYPKLLHLGAELTVKRNFMDTNKPYLLHIALIPHRINIRAFTLYAWQWWMRHILAKNRSYSMRLALSERIFSVCLVQNCSLFNKTAARRETISSSAVYSFNQQAKTSKINSARVGNVVRQMSQLAWPGRPAGEPPRLAQNAPRINFCAMRILSDGPHFSNLKQSRNLSLSISDFWNYFCRRKREKIILKAFKKSLKTACFS